MTREEFINFLKASGFKFRMSVSYEYTTTGNWDDRYVYYFDDGCIVVILDRRDEESVDINLFDIEGDTIDETTAKAVWLVNSEYFFSYEDAYKYLNEE